MIQQHFLQQQRLNHNHDRLLERYHRLLTPKITEFRTFGTSPLPGRNYDQYLNNDNRRNSLVAQSRASIGSSSETYRLMGDGASETLPKNISSIMQHSRSQSVPLVHAEKFEPVQIYEHPMYGPTPAYIRPIFNDKQHLEETNNSDKDDDDDDDDIDIRSHTSGDTSLKIEQNPSKIIKNDDNDSPDRAPKGYISHRKWKAKYENLIPVNPLLYKIYTTRRNGSINKYGQSLYASPSHHRPSNLDDDDDDDIFNTDTTEIESISSDRPRETSLPYHRRYNRLKPQVSPTTIKRRSLEPIHTGNESSDDESSPPDSPVPFLSGSKSNPFTSTDPITMTPSTLNTSVNNMTGNSQAIVGSTNISNIPPAPPLPPSLTAASSSTTRYETPSNLLATSPPLVSPTPTSLTTSNSTNPYQTPSSISVPQQSAPSIAGSTTAKAVTFSGVSSTPAIVDDVSSSSDSDDDEKQKRRRRRKKLAETGAGGDNDSSSSDD